VAWLAPRGRTRLPLDLREDELALMVIGATAKPKAKPPHGRIDIAQLGRNHERQGGCSIELRSKR
jgi:hypothetical protein